MKRRKSYFNFLYSLVVIGFLFIASQLAVKTNIVSTSQAASGQVEIVKSGPASVLPGDEIIYTITTTNNTTSSLNNTIVRDPVPVGVKYYSASDNGQYANNTVSWNLGTMAVSASRAVTMTVITPFTISAPSNLTAQTISSSRVNLTWTDNADNKEGFAIQSSTNSSFTANLHSYVVPADSTSFLVKNLQPSTQYFFHVFAYYTAILDGNYIPSNLSANPVSSSQIDLVWQDNSPHEEGFILDRSTTDDFSQNLASLLIPANTTTFQDTGLAPSTTYYYRIKAIVFAGISANSLNASANTNRVLLAPTNLTATVISSNKVSLNWTDNSDNETGFLVERASNAGFNNSLCHETSPGITFYEDGALNPATHYYYRVRVFNNSGQTDQYSAHSNVVEPTTLTGGNAISPSILTATVVSSTQIHLTWQDNSSNEDSFTIEYSTDPTFNTNAIFLGTDANTNSFDISDLNPSSTYYFHVTAFISPWYTDWSNIISRTTP